MSSDKVPVDVIEMFGQQLNFLDLGREISPEMPHYPGHQKTMFWWHVTHDECKMRLGEESTYGGYGVKAISTCDHISTHVDAVAHFTKDKVDQSVEKITLKELITPAAWIDVSMVPALTHITLDHVKKALDTAEVTLKAGMTLLYYTGIEPYWNNHKVYLREYPGLDEEATRWILDQGVVNIGTDATSLDTPADINYPNHTVHGELGVIHTENICNMTKIPKHQDFYYAMFPLKLVGCTGSPVRAFAIWQD